MIFLSSSLSASSMTLLIDTRDSTPRVEMDINEKTKVVSIETGLMDVLFDKGHIFFNMFTTLTDDSSGQADNDALSYAGEIGAAYLLVLFPEENGASWNLYKVDSSEDKIEGFEDYNQTDSEKKERERWLSLGSNLGESVIVHIH